MPFKTQPDEFCRRYWIRIDRKKFASTSIKSEDILREKTHCSHFITVWIKLRTRFILAWLISANTRHLHSHTSVTAGIHQLCLLPNLLTAISGLKGQDWAIGSLAQKNFVENAAVGIEVARKLFASTPKCLNLLSGEARQRISPRVASGWWEMKAEIRSVFLRMRRRRCHSWSRRFRDKNFLKA